MSAPDWPRRWVQERLHYSPRDLALFRAALTHRSASADNNERLEFLGDAVVNLLIAHALFVTYPQANEGDLSRLRARLVSREPLAEIGAELALGEALQLGSGELKSGGFRRQSILADALEALCGAIFLDGGLAAVEPVIERLFRARIAALPHPETSRTPRPACRSTCSRARSSCPAMRCSPWRGRTTRSTSGWSARWRRSGPAPRAAARAAAGRTGGRRADA